MSLMAMKKNAKWFIIPFLVLIVAGLMMMDCSGIGGGMAAQDNVGSVNGEKIPLQRFQVELQNYQQSEEARTGKSPSALQIAQMRRDLFEFKVQSILMQNVMERYALQASVPEMRNYLFKNPQEVAQHLSRYQQVERMPAFMSDSSIDESRYRNWLAQDSAYDRISMRDLEMQLKSTIIPQMQLQQILNAQLHPTVLEKAHQVAKGETKAKLRFYRVPADSFSVAEENIDEADLRDYFEAHPDSFYHEKAAARLGYVRVDMRPSPQDSALMLELARDLKARTEEGESFGELATSYSSDPGSAEKEGRLEGYQPRSAWVPEFSEAAFNLEPGQVSDPVLTQYGYHLILLHDKKVQDSVEVADVSHILLDITAGTETVESLMQTADEIRKEAQSKGSLAKAVEGKPFEYRKTEIFPEDGTVPLGNSYVQGAHSFAFSEFEAKDRISEPLQNEEAIFILEKAEKFPSGRSFARSESAIREQLIRRKKLDLAQEELEKQRSVIESANPDSLPARIGKAVLDSTGLISPESWVPGFGYAHPVLHKAISQEKGKWSPVWTTNEAAVLVRIEEKQTLSREEVLAKARESFSGAPENASYLVSDLYQRWIAEMEMEAEIQNRVDDLFRS